MLSILTGFNVFTFTGLFIFLYVRIYFFSLLEL